ncbi:hypothetical protein QUF90_01900 [Desulfococcaceae bacterium HSG9]|nr:hypothetical protein [Desulfococcaceae bacterium HSG9]
MTLKYCKGSPRQTEKIFGPPTLSFTRLTAEEALTQLRNHGLPEEVSPSPGTMTDALNRNGYRQRPAVKAEPQKNMERELTEEMSSV